MTKDNIAGKIIIIIIVLAGIGIISIISAAIVGISASGKDMTNGNVAIIQIKGIITTSESSGLFSEGIASSSKIVKQIKRASDNKAIKAIILEINSPGGTPVATDEIAQAIKATNKTTVAWIREIGASGAYWVASSSDYIVANRMSVLGSIGVRGSYLEYSGLLQRYNITYEELHAGELKESGNPFRKMSDKERQKIMDQITKLHKIFISEVAENRGLDYDFIEKLSTGETYLGIEAKGYRLIDEVGGYSEVINFIENNINETVSEIVYTDPIKFSELLSSLSTSIGYQTGKGIGESMLSQEKQQFLLK